MNPTIPVLAAVLAVTSGVYIYTNTNSLDHKIEQQEKQVIVLQNSVDKSIGKLAVGTNQLALSVVAIQTEKVILSTSTNSLSESQTRLKSLLTLRKLTDKALAE